MTKIKKIIIFVVCGFFLSASFALANGDTGQRDLSIQLSNFLGGTVSGLPEFITRIYNVMIGLAGGVASFMLIVSGFQYVLARGDKGKIDKAKKRIENSIVGIFLIFGAYFILNTINPAILSLKLPEIKTIKRDPLAFSYSSLPESEKEQTGSQSGRFSCMREDEPVPTGVEGGNEAWCERHCSEFYTGFEILQGRTDEERTWNCCHCTSPREGVRPPSRDPGSERDCLIQVTAESFAGDICVSYSGTDGQCNLNSAGIISGIAYCSWEPTLCETDEDCVRIGSRHCWGGILSGGKRCYQQLLENGEACGSNEACRSGSCESATVTWSGGISNVYYCAPAPTFPQSIPLDGLCDSTTECNSGMCGIQPRTSRIYKQCF